MQLVFEITDPTTKLQEIHKFNFVSGNWDDYSFKTSFQVTYLTPKNETLTLGTVKIGYADQPSGWTKDSMGNVFESLEPMWFSLGQDVDYYTVLAKKISADVRVEYLKRMHDVAASEQDFVVARKHTVFQHSLMRSVSLSVVNGQYKRVLTGNPALSKFRFSYKDVGSEKRAPVDLSFSVNPESKPPTNIHVLIGRNGVGKTTLLNNMVTSALAETAISGQGRFFGKEEYLLTETDLPRDYFSCVVSVSFSAFDPFVPPPDRPDRARGIAYFYVGMKKSPSKAGEPRTAAKSQADLTNDLFDSICECFDQPKKKERLLSAISRLESDTNFREIGFGELAFLDGVDALNLVKRLIVELSSGHSIVLLSIARLVQTVEEKTLVLMDEPESHLHPPLLSAFSRALSDLLHDRNAVAIVATHSPVVLQEVPSTCVWKLTRSGQNSRRDRPEIETFGENVGVLTREIFGLEVTKSGFHALLQVAVDAGSSFDEIVTDYNDKLGFEAQAILRALVRERDVNRSDTDAAN